MTESDNEIDGPGGAIGASQPANEGELAGDAGLTAPVPTGDYAVDVALSRLRELAGLPVADHVAVFADVHAQLHGALADLDER